jgi:winged helix DNA-binding protein
MEIGVRELSRATLARQLLLRKEKRSAVEVIEQLVGMQAQAPNAAYVGLWTRVADFDAAELAGLMSERAVVRTSLMRATIHLVTARDCRALRPVMQRVLERSWAGSPFVKNLVGIDYDELRAMGHTLLTERPRTRAELAPLLRERWPDRDPDSLVYANTFLTPLVQVTPRGVWGSTGPSAWTPVENWLGEPVGDDPAPDETVLRYLAAFGPASVLDVQAWSGLTKLREVMDRLRPKLITFRDGQGRELFDLPDAPRPDPETPAPPRFLPEYDNVLLSHADRTRINDLKRQIPLPPGNGAMMGTLLVDGFFRGMWRITKQTLTVSPFVTLSTKDIQEVTDEGNRLLGFVTGQPGEVVIDRPAP